jgi:hypothetical protein
MNQPQSVTAPSSSGNPTSWLSRGLVWVFGVWCAGVTLLLVLLQQNATDLAMRAIARMAIGLALVWIIGGGTLSLRLRRPARRWLQRHAHHWQLVFVLCVTGMALLEEAITTTMTNLAPLWSVSIAQAHITASGNYLDVVLLHSVIVFVPMFIAWAWLLTRYDFTPSAVFILYGITGVLAESGTFGAQNVAAAGFWVYVYGLMMFLLAYAIPPQETKRKPGVGASVLAIVLPIVAAIPVVILVQVVHHAFFANLP